jgi:DNA-binding CsgD family transcriptional regulator
MKDNTWPGPENRNSSEVGTFPHKGVKPEPSDFMKALNMSGRSSSPFRLFISFQPQDSEGEKAVEEIIQRLSQQHELFVDRQARIGLSWAGRIEEELRQADFLIIFLSSRSIQSEMVEAEIRTAYTLGKQAFGRPRILPVRLNYSEKLDYPLNVYLEGLDEAFWQGPQDTPGLVNALLNAIVGEALKFPTGEKGVQQTPVPVLEQPGLPIHSPYPTYPTYSAYPAPLPSAQPPRLELPEGTMDPQSLFYIERVTDRVALETIRRQGVTITIKGPRQMGKSSLLVRVQEAALAAGKQVAFLDFQLFDKAALNEPDLFFRQFCEWLTDELGLDSRVEEFWQVPLGNSQRTTRYLQRYLLKELGKPLVLAMDEVEITFDSSFRSDFFGMLRSWHNSRQTNSLWKQLDLVLVTSTEPYQLIENLNQSPFNVGEVIELEDFTAAQVTELNRRHGNPFSNHEEGELINLLAGHPYLARRALYLVATGRLTPVELFATAMADRGPFGDHLRHHLFRLNNNFHLIGGLRQVLQSHSCADETVFFRLRGAGLVKREGRTVIPRCQLYALYFQEKFLEKPAIEAFRPSSKTPNAFGTATEQTQTGVITATATPTETDNPPVTSKSRGTSFIEGLSERETEVLRLVAAGLSNLQIAEKLFLSPHTINRHLTTIYSKIGVSSRTEAARFAHKLGLL